MARHLIGLVLLLIGAMLVGAYRWLRGGKFIPDREIVDGKPSPHSLKEMVERRHQDHWD